MISVEPDAESCSQGAQAVGLAAYIQLVGFSASAVVLVSNVDIEVCGEGQVNPHTRMLLHISTPVVIEKVSQTRYRFVVRQLRSLHEFVNHADLDGTNLVPSRCKVRSQVQLTPDSEAESKPPSTSNCPLLSPCLLAFLAKHRVS